MFPAIPQAWETPMLSRIARADRFASGTIGRFCSLLSTQKGDNQGESAEKLKGD